MSAPGETAAAQAPAGGLPPMPAAIALAPKLPQIDWRRVIWIVVGLGIFAVFYFMPGLPDAADPAGKVFKLSWQGRLALGLFLMAGLWWVTEIMPIGVTAISIGVMQVLFHMRSSRDALADFMDPSVWFIFGSMVIGLAFTRSGLTKRLAYKMLSVVGERTSIILLGAFLVTVAMTHIMAHTAVAAALFPLLLAINSLYDDSGKPTRFGKALFMGSAWAAGAGSIITLLGSARGVAAAGMYKEFTGKDVGFFEVPRYLAPVGWAMTFCIWLIVIVVLKPERAVIPGLRQRAQALASGLGPVSGREKFVVFTVVGVVALFILKSFVPAFHDLDRAGIMLLATVLFFVAKTLTVEDLETLPWNIILLFGGAMSIGFCLWRTGAAEWLAVHWLTIFLNAHWLVFVLGIAFFVLAMTNFIMNVAAMAISLPVALVIARYLGVTPELILFSCLVVAGMPFNLLIGAAPNAIAYESKQFTSGEFFKYGTIASVVLMAVLTLFVYVLWPLLGMPTLTAAVGR